MTCNQSNGAARKGALLRLLLGALAILAALQGAARADSFDAPAGASGRKPPVIYLHRRVTDLTGTLSESDIMRIAHPLAQIERLTGHQVAVLLVPSARPQRIDRFAYAELAANGIGRLHDDDGMLIVVARQDHQVFIATGPGLKRDLTQRQAATLIRQVMAPHFRHEDFAGGLEAAAMSLAPRLEQGGSESARIAGAARAMMPPDPAVPPVLPPSPPAPPAIPAPPVAPAARLPLPAVPSPLTTQLPGSAAAHDADLLNRPVRGAAVPALATHPARQKPRRRLPLKEIIGVVVFLVVIVVLRGVMRRRRPAPKSEDAEDDIKI